MLEGRRVAVLIEKGFEDIELAESIRVTKEAGGRVVVLSGTGLEICCGKRGILTVYSDLSVSESNSESFDAVIVPGGEGITGMCSMPGMLSFLWIANRDGILIAAISEGVRLLKSASILKGRKVTSVGELAGELGEAGALWTDEPVVRDRNLITARKTSDLPRFNKAIIETLGRNAR